MKWLWILLVIIVAGYASCQLAYPTYTHRYRLTIGIEVDGKESVGSSVIEVNARHQPQILPHLGAIIRVRGEAVRVDLGRHGPLFALLAHGPDGQDPTLMAQLALRAFALPRRPGLENYQIIGGLRGSRDLALQDLPTLVLFADISNVDSARVVRPDRLDEDIAPGVRLLRAEVEVTSEPVTRRLAAQLPWLELIKNDRKRYISYRGVYQASYPQFIGEL